MEILFALSLGQKDWNKKPARTPKDIDVIFLPGHTSKPAEFDGLVIQTTIGKAKKDIEIIRLEEEQFVNEILKRISPTPENYLEIVESNLAWSSILNTELEAGANRCAIN